MLSLNGVIIYNILNSSQIYKSYWVYTYCFKNTYTIFLLLKHNKGTNDDSILRSLSVKSQTIGNKVIINKFCNK